MAVPLPVPPVPRYKPAVSRELVTLSTQNLEAAWNHSKDRCLTVWCDCTEVSSSDQLFCWCWQGAHWHRLKPKQSSSATFWCKAEATG